jgi:DNA-binding NarL/FixJ family response regulator
MQQARLMLGDGVFEKAWQEGQTMSMEQAIAFALELMPGIQPSARTQPEPATAAKPGQEYPNELSRREVEVLRLLAEGLPNDQIAERLFLSANTVRAHLYSVYSKLDVSNRGAAIRFATDHGLT